MQREDDMPEDSLEDLTRRLDRIERETRRWRAGSLIAVCAAFLLGAASVGPSDEIRAKRFVSVDDAGRPRLELGQLAELDSRGQRNLGLSLYDEYRNPVMRLDANGLARFNAGGVPSP
jgi:hypothetical protein